MIYYKVPVSADNPFTFEEGCILRRSYESSGYLYCEFETVTEAGSSWVSTTEEEFESGYPELDPIIPPTEEVTADSAELDEDGIIQITTPHFLADGTLVKFEAPCDSGDAQGISFNGEETYQVYDAANHSVLGCPGFFSTGGMVSVVINREQKIAYMQSQATTAVPAALAQELGIEDTPSANAALAVLTAHTNNKENPHEVTAEQVPYDNSRTDLASDTAQGAIDELYSRMYGDMKVRVTVYETGTTTPIAGVAITGISDALGGVLYADESGVAEGVIMSDEDLPSVTVQVDSRYIDLTGQTKATVIGEKGKTKEVTIFATRVSNPSGKIETFTASTQKMVTNAVTRVDVHCVGAGKGGSSGYAKLWNSEYYAKGGSGGAGGESKYQNSVIFDANKPFQITVGAGGKGGKSPGTESITGLSGNTGTSGGMSSCLGITAMGGTNSPTDGAQASDTKSSSAKSALSNTVRQFGESSLPVAGGGDGGGGAAYINTIVSNHYSEDKSSGGTPNGGDGGPDSKSGGHAKGHGGGGGGGSGRVYQYSSAKPIYYYGYSGGDGGNGVVYVRWFYA